MKKVFVFIISIGTCFIMQPSSCPTMPKPLPESEFYPTYYMCAISESVEKSKANPVAKAIDLFDKIGQNEQVKKQKGVVLALQRFVKQKNLKLNPALQKAINAGNMQAIKNAYKQ